MPRYMCVYFISSKRNEINRINKRTKVIESETGSQAIDLLVTEHDAKCIKMMRDLEKPRFYVNDIDLHKLESHNNYKLWLTQEK